MSPGAYQGLLTAFIALILTGLILMCAEVIVPGGVLGVIGGIALLIAIVLGFIVFPVKYAILVALGIVVLVGAALIIWIRLFPKSRLGKTITLSDDEKDFHSSERGLQDLLHMEGEAKSDLRPAGYATLDNRRVDVVTEGGMVKKGARIRVIEVEGNRVVVREVVEPKQYQ